MLKIAILDDYVGLALRSADWAALGTQVEITVFERHLAEDEAADLLATFDVLCTMRERMSLPRTLIARLPRLKLILVVGAGIPNLDLSAATDHGVMVCHSDQGGDAFRAVSSATPELAWGLLIATVRHLAQEDRRMREGLWQGSTGTILAGRTLGLLGLGRIGRRMARYAKAFDMPVIAWSQNLTAAAAAAEGVARVDKDALFAEADILSIHTRLSDRTRGLVGARELGLMKRQAYLINTSRGPIVDEGALLAALGARQIAGAGLDVFDIEPLPADHPLRAMDNVTLAPHIGYNTRETLSAFYGDMPEAIAAFAAGRPIRLSNPEVAPRPFRPSTP
jgi:phosphoglycerate dehydrogenase-like enzyme